MKAIAQDTYGTADVLSLQDVGLPTVRDADVLISVRAAGVDPGVWHIMTGQPYLVRAMGFGFNKPKVRVRGRDVAGVVESVGASVTRFQPGDRVFGTCESGSFAEFAVAPEKQLALMTEGLTFEQAAALPISGGTALQAVRDAGRVQPGQRVLVIGAAGGVGAFAVQIATAFGASVTGVCRPSAADFVRSLGAVGIIDYTSEDVDRDGPVYDVVIDTAGNRPLSVLRRALTPKGRLVLVGGEHGGGPLLGGFDRLLLRAPIVSLFVGQSLMGLTSKERTADFSTLAELVEAGSLSPAIDRVFTLADAPEAIRHLSKGHLAGKVIVSLQPQV
jgi:NADPH:quinone reductase-like Zn-dependent oxidoreductase